MTPEILFPDAVEAVVEHLTARLAARSDTAPVRTRVPNPRPERFVIVRRLGGPKRNLVVDAAQVDVQAWGASEQDAHDLAQKCRAAVNAMPGAALEAGLCVRVDEFAGPALLPDPESDTPRYVASYEVAMRGIES